MRLRSAFVVLALSLSTAACGSSSSAGTGSASPLAQWHRAYAFLSAQTRPTQISCNWAKMVGGRPAMAPRVATFYNFSDTSAWKSHVLTRYDKFPAGTFELCEATVPTSIPYGPAIEPFLKSHGLFFGPKVRDLTSIEIAYAGASPGDPDITYRDKPGLFGLMMALAQLSSSPVGAGANKIVQPKTDASAAEDLRYARPLLAWYGYKG